MATREKLATLRAQLRYKRKRRKAVRVLKTLVCWGYWNPRRGPHPIFSIFEIVESILQNFKMFDILTKVNKVCWFWTRVIHESPMLQVFFREELHNISVNLRLNTKLDMLFPIVNTQPSQLLKKVESWNKTYKDDLKEPNASWRKMKICYAGETDNRRSLSTVDIASLPLEEKASDTPEQRWQRRRRTRNSRLYYSLVVADHPRPGWTKQIQTMQEYVDEILETILIKKDREGYSYESFRVHPKSMWLNLQFKEESTGTKLGKEYYDDLYEVFHSEAARRREEERAAAARAANVLLPVPTIQKLKASTFPVARAQKGSTPPIPGPKKASTWT